MESLIQSRSLKRAVALVLISIGALWGAGSKLVAPAPSMISEETLGLPHESVTFPSESGALLRGWFSPGFHGRGTVILMHGVRSNRLSMVGRARFLNRAGFSVLLFDFQAHGESSGRTITFGHLESSDARAAVRFVQQRRAGEPIFVIGVSLGGASAVLADPPLAVQALVLEAVYPSIDIATSNRLRIVLGNIGPVFAPLLLLQLGPRLGVDWADLSPEQSIRRVSAPVLVIAGSADRRTTLADSHRLYDAAPEGKELWVIPGAAHVDFHAFAGGEYEARVLTFLERSMQQRSTEQGGTALRGRENVASVPGGTASGRVMRSGEERVSLLELYTSEGCSSCPPAEEWLAQLQTDPGLWTHFVAVQFHVDYWDRLGWPDPFARPEYTARQRGYAREWGTDRVYTPEFVLNGRELPHPVRSVLDAARERVGVLTVASREGGGMRGTFAPVRRPKGRLTLIGALLRSGVTSEVSAGENRGEQLRHNFVVLRMVQSSMTESAASVASGVLPEYVGELVPFDSDLRNRSGGDRAVVFWVTEGDSFVPLQAVGAPLG